MKIESKIMFWVFLASLPACYFTIAPAIVSALVYVLLLAIDTAHGNAKVEIDKLKGAIEALDEGNNSLWEAVERKPKATTVNLSPLLERLDKLETSVNSVNLALGFSDLSKSIK